MQNINTNEIRQKFIDFFVNHDHKHVSSSTLIPNNDPTLLFVNSGMVQFKNVFTGVETREYTKAVSSQKSIRAGGKHNDLENVGYTSRHHTFFEMLGNFSFGDYFKEEAIYYAWKLLINEFQIPAHKLYVTVYHDDNDAISLWKKIAHLEDQRIIKISTQDNFWSMGDKGPCGPCSEIFYDHGENIKGGLPGTLDQEGDRYIEIWNLVFMEFEQIDQNTRIELPKKCIDTGMGLERIAAVLQNVHDNYDIDLFKTIISSIEEFTKVSAKRDAKFSHRVIADHLRSSAFLIAEGVTPSNDGRGYVLRRILRRAMRHIHSLGQKEPLMHRLLPTLIQLMGNTYPELDRAKEFIESTLYQEEMRFKQTLDTGLSLLYSEMQNLQARSLRQLDGEIAFKLYDTYGFPVDLTADILKSKNIEIDMDGFTLRMQEQKNRSRQSWKGSGENIVNEIWFDIFSKYGSTEFLGYTESKSEAEIFALIQDDKCLDFIDSTDSIIDSIDANRPLKTLLDDTFLLVTNQTPFYAQSGGQMGDIGTIIGENFKLKVIDTLKYPGDIHAHVCVIESGIVRVGDIANLQINVGYRQNLRIHHSATHILHAVLRKILGTHVTQKGSLVSHDKLRFDISHPYPISKTQLYEIEDKVNEIIRNNSQVHTVLMDSKDAIAKGAMALFGEKYHDEVRVVSMGSEVLEDNSDDNQDSYSTELCGGTHTTRTGDIGLFKIINESGIASGVRRIEAVCGQYAIDIERKNTETVMQLSDLLKSSKVDVVAKLQSLILQKKSLEEDLKNAQISALELSHEQIDAISIQFGSIRIIYKILNDLDPKIVRAAALALVGKMQDLLVVYISSSQNKLSITTATSTNISRHYPAGSIANQISLFLGGKGCNSEGIVAQAGGTDINKLTQIKDYLVSILVCK